LAALCESRGRWKEAIEARRERAALVERLHGKGHWRAVTARLATAYTEKQFAVGPDGRARRRLASQLTQVGFVHYQRRDFARARSQFEQAWRLRRFTLGGDHPVAAMSLHHLATLDKDQGKPASALRLYAKVLAASAKYEGEQHPQYAFWLDRTCAVYYDLE